MYSTFSSRWAISRFKAAKHESAPGRLVGQIDYTLWNPKRILAYTDSLRQKTDEPLAVLRVPNLNLEVPVYDGTDDLTLDRGVGRITGTAQIGEAGNTGIAGHRDGFFRGLKDVSTGDVLELDTRGRTIHYIVSNTEIVEPRDTGVVADRGLPELTLVTCFPFYFVGNAPQRFIVHAIAIDFDGPTGSSITSAGETTTKEKLK